MSSQPRSQFVIDALFGLRAFASASVVALVVAVFAGLIAEANPDGWASWRVFLAALGAGGIVSIIVGGFAALGGKP